MKQTPTNPLRKLLILSALPLVSFVHEALADWKIEKRIEPRYTGAIEFAPNKDRYQTGEKITITATPSGRFTFEKWTGDLTADGGNPYSGFQVQKNAMIGAVFKAGYLADRPLLSPRKNVFYPDQPRDLWFQVHQNSHPLIALERNRESVRHQRKAVENLKDSEPLPDSLMIRVPQAVIAAFGPGLHQLDFHFDNGQVLDAGIEVTSSDAGHRHDMNIISFFVDHGDAVLIDLPNGETLLIDTGTREAAEKYVVPFLKKHLPEKKNGRQRIDHIFITHWHYDHFYGLGTLLEAFEIGNVRYNLEHLPNHEGRYTNRSNPDDPYQYGDYGFAPGHWDEFRIGNRITDIGSVDILILNAGSFDEQDETFRSYHPEHYNGYYGRNNRSLAFKLRFGDFIYNHGGDVYQHAQHAILNTFQDDVRAHVYHANHHFHGGVSREYLVATEPYLFLTSANSAVYDRDAFSNVVLNQVIPELQRTSPRFRENLLSFEVGHQVIRIDGSKNWADDTTELWYETYYLNNHHHEEYTVPNLFRPSNE